MRIGISTESCCDFMDAYEEHVLGDLKHLSKEELQELYTKVVDQLKRFRVSS